MRALRALGYHRLMTRVSFIICISLAAGCDTPAPELDGGSTSCDSDRDCSASGLVCDLDEGICVACVRDADCPTSEVCIANECAAPTACTSSTMCPGLVCDLDRGICVECVGDADCDGAEICLSSRCERACDDDADCAGRMCDSVSGVCVECLSDAHCVAPEICDPSSRTCVELCTCATDADCDDGSFCNGQEICGGCTVGCTAAASPCVPGEMCDELLDRCVTDCATPDTWLADSDADGFGDVAHIVWSCERDVPGFVRAGGDCDDADASSNPSMSELCDGSVDEDCDHAVDEGCACPSGATRVCGSEEGECGRGTQGCGSGGWSSCAGIFPRPEICNGADDDCDGASDESPDIDGACGRSSCIDGACASAPGARAVTQSYRGTFALMEDGTVRMWGRILDDGTWDSLTPIAASNMNDALAIDTEGRLLCVITREHGLACTGTCLPQVLGDTSGGCGNAPGVFTRFRGGPYDIVDLSVGTSHSCYVSDDGAVFCFGSNGSGQLGDGTTTESPRPVRVVGIDDAIDVGAGSLFSCAVRADGRVMCWGRGAEGQLGNGTSVSLSGIPVEVSGIDDAVAIGVATSHACAQRSSGTVQCWGANGIGVLGDGTTAPRDVPVTFMPVPVGASVPQEISGYATCVTRPDGGVSCSGSNEYGQLGDGTRVNSLSAVEVLGLDDVAYLAGGLGPSQCAVTRAGQVWCWGQNDHGQLGDGTTENRDEPVRVLDIP